jgi:DNA-binding SARP family transcriptional activator
MLLLSLVNFNLRANDLNSTRKNMERIEANSVQLRTYEMGIYLFNRALEALLRQDLPAALDHIKVSLKFVDDDGIPFGMGYHRLVKAKICQKSGQRNEAAETLESANKDITKTNSKLLQFYGLLLRAQLALSDDNEAVCRESLKQAFCLGRNQKYVFTPEHWVFMTGDLCVAALERGIEADYVAEVARKCNLVPNTPPLHLKNWPWPVKIHTLGRFGLMIDGKPLRFPKKAQRRPLEMLKLLIALGGREVEENQLSDFLWPDTDGDRAQQSFKTNLHRLRKLMVHPEALIRKGRKVTLNQDYCWVDIWHFERLVGETDRIVKEEAEKSVSKDVIIGHLQKVVDLYKGPFLNSEGTSAWHTPTRERLRNKFVRSVLMLGHIYEQSGKMDKALDLYQKGIEIENLVERFYQRLMSCYYQLGQKADALFFYRQFKDTSVSLLGIGPSEETETLRKIILPDSELSN